MPNLEYIALNRNNFYINYQKERNITWKAICFSLCLHLPVKLQHLKRRETKWPINQRENELPAQTWPRICVGMFSGNIKNNCEKYLETIVETLCRMYEQILKASEELETVNNT